MNLIPGLMRKGDDGPSFNGKVVVVYCRSGGGGGVVQDVRMVTIGVNQFLVGTLVMQEASLQGRWAETEGWFNVGEILQMYVFNSIDAARNAYHPIQADADQT